MVAVPVHDNTVVDFDPASTSADDTARPLAGNRAAMAALTGAQWEQRHQDIIARLPHGTTVAVNVADDRYVTGPSGLEAMDKFERQFGAGAVAWVFEVGVPISLGGFAWPRSSGE